MTIGELIRELREYKEDIQVYIQCKSLDKPPYRANDVWCGTSCQIPTATAKLMYSYPNSDKNRNRVVLVIS